MNEKQKLLKELKDDFQEIGEMGFAYRRKTMALDKYQKWATILTQEVKPKKWYGKDSMKIVRERTEWRIITHNKGKDGVIKKQITFVPNKVVEEMFRIIKRNVKKGDTIKNIELIEDVARLRKISPAAIGWGKNRAKVYFPFYNYPMKILEETKRIKYGSKTTTRLI